MKRLNLCGGNPNEINIALNEGKLLCIEGNQ